MSDPKVGTSRAFQWAVFFLFMVALTGVFTVPLELVFRLIGGWVFYLAEVLPQVSFNPSVLVDGLLALTLATYGLHRMLRWWLPPLDGLRPAWRWAGTLKITAMALLMFATSLAATGFIHQVGWLFKTKDWIQNRRPMIYESANVSAIGAGLQAFADAHDGKFPETLTELVPNYLRNNSPLYSSGSDQPPEPLTYFPGYTTASPADQIIVCSPRPLLFRKRMTRAVLQVDGSSMLMPEAEFQKRLGRTKGF